MMAMTLWDALLHPDREESVSAERADVGRAANALEVGEFQLLQLAYRAWHDRELLEPEMGRLFHDYMVNDRVPHWARHYARQIMRLDAAGRLDVNKPCYHRYDSDYGLRPPSRARRFWIVAGFIVVMLGGVAMMASYAPEKSTSHFPPYFNDQELQPADQR